MSHRLRGRFENTIGQIAWFQCAQNILGLCRLGGSSMSDYQILPCLYGGLVRHDAVFWYAYAEQTGTDGTQTTDYHRVLQSGDDPCHQWTANQHRAYRGHPKECGAKQ
jgi:hypothetical protein